MNLFQTRQFFRNLWRLAAILGVLSGAGGVRGADSQQPSRFLLIFETSPVLKKNLPAVRQELGRLFSSNLQNEIQMDDDLAVWTVDQTVHRAFPLATWSPADAEAYAERLDDFLNRQKFTRHASLASVQPLLDRVVKNSERLTVIIFCDSESRLAGTPYDSGVNEIITNAAAKIKRGPVPLVLVLRSYHGEYLGCSVNRTSTLNFPKFPPPVPQPPPPMPQPPPAIAKAPPVVNQPAPVAPPVSGPIVVPVPAMIIVGTNTTTNVSATAAAPPAPGPAAPMMSNAPTTNRAVATTPAPAPGPEPKVVSLPPSNPPPVQPPPVNPAPPPVNSVPAPVVEVQKPPSPPPAGAPTSTLAMTSPAKPPGVATFQPSGSAVESAPNDRGYLWPLTLAGGALAAAAGLVIWLVARTRRPRGSLITSSMLDDPHLPPRK